RGPRDRAPSEGMTRYRVAVPVQLPSVSVGSILRDLTRSKKVASTILTVVFRQKEGGILDIATKVRNQEQFIGSDFYGMKRFGNDTILHSVKQDFINDGYIHYYKKALQEYNAEDILVLSPTNKHRFGTKAINKNLQVIANDYEVDKLQIEYGQTTFRVGDIVMNLENTYNLINVDGQSVDVFNGDVGIIEDIDIKNKKMYINYDGNLIEVNDTEFSKLSLAYSVSIHKSQGSGVKCVILIVDKSSKYQLNANLIYTGVTRAKEKLIIVGQSESINYGLRRMESDKRKSFLYDFIVGNM
ncbi:MAG TPA: ATP-binding domain-containing protein, partial [Bacteroidales bacterium]|nr:ATP-binding domain-containing protein [Bacteroidales bacterium]